MTSIGHGLYVERLTAGSTAAARNWLLITRKIIMPPPDSRDSPDGQPYFAKKRFPPDCWDLPATSSHGRKCIWKKTIRPPDYWDPPAISSHARKCIRKTTIRPPTAGTHQLHIRTQGSASRQKKENQNDSPPDCWDPLATSSQARKCFTVGTHLVEAYVALSFWSRTCMYILVDVEARTCRSRGAYVS